MGAKCYSGRCVEPCSSDSDCSDFFDACLGGYCSADPVKVIEAVAEDPTEPLPFEYEIDPANALRLHECISDDNYIARVTLGSEPLCVWQDADNANLFCHETEDTEDRQCPTLRSQESGDDCTSMSRPSGTAAVTITEAIGVFDSVATGPKGFLDCSALRGLRRNPDPVQADVDLSWVTASGAFHPARLPSLGEGLGWEPFYGGYSAITWGGRALYLTGTTSTGPTTAGWPCDSASAPLDCTESGPNATNLFCATIDCKNSNQRAHLNDRMMRAALAAAEMTGGSLENFSFPVYFLGGSGGSCNFNLSGLQPVTLEGDAYCPEYPCPEASHQYNAPAGCTPGSPPSGGPQPGYFYNRYQGRRSLESQQPCQFDAVAGWFCNRTPSPVEARIMEVHPAACMHAWNEFLGYEPSPCITEAVDTAYAVNSTLEVELEAWRTIRPDIALETPTIHKVRETAPRDQLGNVGSALNSWQFGIDKMGLRDAVRSVDQVPGSYEKYASGIGAAATPIVFGAPSFELFGGLSFTEEPTGYFVTVLSGGAGSVSERAFVLPPSAPEHLANGVPVWQATPRLPIMAPYYRTKRTLLDGFELLCDMAKRNSSGCTGEPPVIARVEDVHLAETYLNCVADAIEHRAANAVLSNVPIRAVAAFQRQAGLLGTVPPLGGDFGTRVNELAGALRTLQTKVPALASVIRQLGSDIAALQSALRQAELRRDLSLVNAAIGRVNREMALAQSALAAWGAAASFNYGGAIAGAASTAMQAAGNSRVEDLVSSSLATESDLFDENANEAMIEFNRRTGSHSDQLYGLAGEIDDAITSLGSALTQIEGSRRKARSALRRAMLMDSETMEAQYEATNFLRLRLNTARIRYEEALTLLCRILAA